MDVVAERLERRDVHHFGPVGKRAQARAAHQCVDALKERGQRFAGPGGRGDQNVVTLADDRPALELRLGGLAKAAGKPFGNEGIKAGKHATYHSTE